MNKLILLVLVLLVSMSTSLGQTRGLKLIEKDKFTNAEKKLTRELGKDPNDIAVNFSMAILLIQKNYEKYDAQKAYAYLMKSKSLYDNLKDEKEIKNLNKIPVNPAMFQNYTDTICRLALSDAVEVNKIEAYDNFLEYYKSSPAEYKNKAILNRDVVAFKVALDANTVDGFQYFISKYPDAVQNKDAIKRRNALAYGKARASDNISGYKEFINKYPEATEIAPAWERIFELAFAQAEKENTIPSYKKYIAEYSKSKQSEIALSRIHEMAFAQAEKENTSKAYKRFTEEYPASKLHDKAFKLFEEKQFTENIQLNSWNSYKSFIVSYPDNSWIAAAKDSLFQIAMTTGNTEALTYCIETFTDNKKNGALIRYHDIITMDGERNTLDMFYNKYNEEFLNDIKAKDYELADMAKNLSMEQGYNSYNFSRYDEYIRAAAPRELAFVALQRVISPDLTNRDWNSAINKINSYLPLFGERNKKLKDLISLLGSNTDNSIVLNNLGNAVNTEVGGEYSPVLTADDKTLYFCGRFRPDNVGDEDIYVSKKINGVWSNAVIVPDLSSAGTNDAPESVTADGTKMLVFKSGKLAYSEKTSTGWSEAKLFPDNINAGNWQSDAMISSNGKALFFASTKAGGYNLDPNSTEYHGGNEYPSDIYVSLLNENNEWGEPINLGNVINTPFAERSPFLHPDMKTLYFCSDGHGGMGKLDVFKSTRLSDTCWNCWSEPVNLGKEINSVESDWGYRITTDGLRACFAKKINAQQRQDIYWFSLPKSLRPDLVATISGRLVDKNNRTISAEIRWEDLETGKNVGFSKSDPTDGSFFVVLPLGKIYGYYVNKSDYFPISNNIDLRNNNKPVKIDEKISMVTFQQMVEDGTAVPVNNLFFNFGESVILPFSIPELKRVAAIIKENHLKVQISGHTDNIGDDKQNQILSDQRALAVKTFLENEGCSTENLTYKGFGKTKPVATNETEAGRAKNRRVELKFVK